MFINKFLPVIVIIFIVSSCNKKLDDPAPDTSISEGEIQSKDIPLLVKGAYSSMLGSFYPQSYPIFDIYSDDVISIQGGTPTQFDPQSYEANNPNPDDGFGNTRFYIASYTAIGNANFLIDFIRSRELSNLNGKLGEALGIRAINYLNLVQAYKGVVITLESDKEEEVKRSQNTEEEVYAQVIQDLKEAEGLLPTFTTADALSKEAVQLLLARVYLNRGEYELAKQFAETVIESGSAGLTSDFSSNFIFSNGGNSELLFRLVQGPSSTSYDRSGLFPLYSPGLPFRGPSGAPGNGQTWLADDLVNSYEAGDVRASLLYRQFSAGAGKEVTYLMKFSIDTLQSTNPFISYPLIRLSEAYLISAEADARIGTVDVLRYNELRATRNVGAKSENEFADAAAFLNEIEMERRREFVGEGLRWQDMKRFGTAEAFLQSKGQNNTRLYFPFPTLEISRNNKLVQNNGY